MHSSLISESGAHFVRDLLSDFPRPDRAAADAVKHWAASQGLTLDPDQVEAVTLHYRYHNGQCLAQVVQSMSLTQALLANWQGESNNDLVAAALHAPWAGDPPQGPLVLVDRLDTQGLLAYGADYQVFNGLYRHVTPQTYGPDNHVKLSAEAFQQFIWDLDFQTPYKAMLNSFWNAHQVHYGQAAKISFIAACNRQSANGSLSDEGRRLAWQVAGLEAAPTWASLGLSAKSRPVVRVSALNLYGYAATDLLCLSNAASGLTLLYMPGNSAPLHEFNDSAALKTWLAEQCRGASQRAALLQHFAPADATDGLSYSGLETVMIGLGLYPKAHHFAADDHPGFATSGYWNPQDIVNYKPKEYSPLITGDLFQALARRQKKRAFQDADYLIETDSRVTKAKWRGYLSSAINVLAPLALVMPALAPLFAVGGVAQFGLGMDALLTGKTLAQRQQGLEELAYGLFNAMALPHAAAPVKFEAAPWKFVAPKWLNGRLGYPLSPIDPPHWPALPLEEPVAQAFMPAPAMAPLPEANAAVANSVMRVLKFDGQRDELQCAIGGYLTRVTYDIETDTFIKLEDLNELDPPRYVAPQPPGNGMVEWNGADHPTTNQHRMASLRALGIDLHIPVDFAAMRATDVSAIPAKISSIWVGEALIEPDLLANVGRNAASLVNSGYEYQLFLSNASASSFARNRELLLAHAPNLKVIELEQHPLYEAFSQSPYYEQYRAALDGNGGVAINNASAADVLRFQLLKYEGGLFMDMDDTLLQAEQPPAEGVATAAVASVPLVASPDGLLVYPPLRHSALGMNWEYNTSLIGSHAQNPTLDAINEEMRRRFAARPEFYHSRPNYAVDPAGFRRYAEQLSAMTGPRLFTDVIQQALPALGTFRQAWLFNACPVVNAHNFFNEGQFIEMAEALCPLSRVARVGSTMSWRYT
ncbi:dermonecrotic toxin domain-containing protein [Pseudomonas sp. nanlin1]|uniref:dermonecrotic toxin domain-containing protein n=1 Tax=Pseudomonas sp. nanlin1 TaxID=3040605 RepID=UPI00388EB0DC